MSATPTSAKPISGRIERVDADARIVGLGDLFKPREPVVAAEQAPPPPDPRLLLEQERVRVLDAARKDGHAAGMRDAEKAIETRALAAEREWREKFEKETARLADTTRRLEALIAALPDAVAEIERQVETLTVEATFAATLRIVAEAARDEAMVLDFCREALAEYALRPVRLRVHPALVAAVAATLASDDIRVEGDPRLAPGQCRIESEKGLYDISLAHRLDALKDQLLASLDDSATDLRDARVAREPRA
ncbi:FliH/SctL family protein [Lysobacter hankyongensis]|uniref:Flagellar assembly protein FliH n=1 Tax=Lysobacter hankyongensis TaxID=1176535 RepID=A0ABP9CBK6_9GAMM